MTDATQPRMARGRMLSAGILVAALFALLAFAPIASATPNPVGSGKTKLNLNKNWTRYLKTFGIKIQKVGKATYNGRQATLPIYEGTIDPANGLGRWKAAGGLKFSNGKKGAPVKAIEVRTNGTALVGKIGGKRMKIATMAGWNYSRNGFGVAVKVKKFKLTGSAANLLNQRTGYPQGKPKPFLAGKVIASSYNNVQPATVAIEAMGESASLSLAPQALAKLQHVGTPPFPVGTSPVQVKLSPLPPTTFDPTTLTAGFPIGGGTIGPHATAGTIVTSGGLKLVQNLEAVSKKPGDVTTLTMQNIWLDLGAKTASVEVVIENPVTSAANLGNLGRASIADINLEGATITADPSARTVSVTNASVTLQAVTAATLNQVFIEGLEKASVLFVGQEKFAAGDPLGLVSFTVHTQ